MALTIAPSADELPELRGRQLPTRAPQAIVAVALLAGGGAFALGAGPLRSVLLLWFVTMCRPIWSAAVEGRRQATDRLVTVLQHSSPGRWTTLSHTRLPVFEPECRAVRPSTYDLPYRFDVSGGAKGYAVQIVRRGGEWTVRRSRY